MSPEAFRAALTKLGLTQSYLCRILQLDKGTVNKWATGRSAIPRAVVLLLTLMADGRIGLSDVERAHLAPFG